MSSMEPNNNNLKKHSSEDQDRMSVKDQVYSVGVKLQIIEMFPEREDRSSIFSIQWMCVKISLIRQ